MLASLSLALLTPSIEPRRLSIPFSALIEQATVICIGTVDEVRTVPITKEAWPRAPDEPVFGHVVVERILKGPSDLKGLWHEGWASPFEDFTRPGQGVRGLLLLGPGLLEEKAPLEVQKEVAHSLGAEPILRNVGSGWGLIAIRKSDAGEFLDHSSTFPIAFREAVKDLPDFGARLADVVGYIEALERFSGNALAIHAYSSESGDDASFDLRVLTDGNVRLATNVDGRGWRRELVTFEKWEPGTWDALKTALESRLEKNRLDLHRESKVRGTRLLQISLSSASLDFSDANVVADKLEGKDRTTYAAVLRCWSEVRSRIAAKGIADHSQEDKAWLEGH